MRKILLIVFGMFLFSFSGFSQNNVDKTDVKKTNQTADKNKLTKEVKKLRKAHARFIKKNQFQETLAMSKEERKNYGLPPNKYAEEEWVKTINPRIGMPTPEKLNEIRKSIENQRNQSESSRVAGDGIDNAWVSRGPNNVGGRTKAIIFDPTDASGNTVIAAGVSGGLWKNTNITSDASVWTMMNIPEHLNVLNITVDPIDNATWYVGTGESYTGGDASGNGIWKTTNAGGNWIRIFGGGIITSTIESQNTFTINPPSSISGNYAGILTTAFGPVLASPITQNIVLVNDGSGEPTLGVNALTNAAAINGKIALIRRGSPAAAPGTGTFVLKVKNAQDAGALAVIVMNNVSGDPAAMGGTDTTITIPSVAITKELGDVLEAAVTSGVVNGTIKPAIAGQFIGLSINGITNINDIAIKNNNGISEIYVAVGDGIFPGTNKTTLFNPRGFGLYKSVDGGVNWVKLNLPLTDTGNEICPNDIEIAVGGKVWVSSTDSRLYRNGGGKIFVSSDNGATFTLKHTVVGNGGGQRVEIEASNTTPDKIYVLSELAQATTTDAIECQILRTTDGFATAPTVLSLPNDTDSRSSTYGFTGAQAFYDLFIESDSVNDANVYVGGLNIHKSTNSGNSWVQISEWQSSSSVHSDQHAMTFKPGNSNVALFGCDGGVYYCSSLSTTNNTSQEIPSRNNGFVTAQMVGVAVMPNGVTGTSGDFFVTGLQDNGTQYFPASLSSSTGAAAGMNSSSRTQGGDGGIPLFAQDSDKYYVSNYVYNDNMNSRNLNGTIIKTLSDGTQSRGLFYPAMALNSTNDFVFSDFTGGTTFTPTVRRYGNIKATGTVTRVDLTNALLTTYPTALQVGKVTKTTLYIGTLNGKLLMVTGSTSSPVWSDITGINFVGTISDIEFGANDSQIFVTIKNYGVTSVWYTRDGGLLWNSIEGNLPDMPVNCILQNPLKTDELMIGTELGVWYVNTFNPNASEDQSLNWIPSFNGMSNVKVTDLDLQPNLPVNPTSYNVYAATYGRGVFSGVFNTAVLSTEEIATNKKVSIYPNPVKDNLNININDFSGEVFIKIIDVNGREVLNKTITNFNGSNTLELSRFASGIYILKLTGEGLNYSKKIILE